MNAIKTSLLLIGLAAPATGQSSLLREQAAPSANPSSPATRTSATMALSLDAPKAPLAIGQTPWIYLTIKNLSDTTIRYPDDLVRVEGAQGEPPQTLRQRQLTRARLGEEDLDRGGPVLRIKPGQSFTTRYDLSLLYDLSRPGKYTVFIELFDPLASEKDGDIWVRSPMATVNVAAPQQ